MSDDGSQSVIGVIAARDQWVGVYQAGPYLRLAAAVIPSGVQESLYTHSPGGQSHSLGRAFRLYAS